MTSTSQLNGIFYITWQECMWWYWRHNQRSSCIQQSTKNNNWSDLNSQKLFWVLHPKHNWHPSFFLYLLKKCDLLSQCWLNDLRTVEPCQELACIIAFEFPKITNVSFIAEFLVINACVYHFATKCWCSILANWKVCSLLVWERLVFWYNY